MTRLALRGDVPDAVISYLTACGLPLADDGEAVVVVGTGDPTLLDRAGVLLDGSTVAHELRVRPGPDASLLDGRLGPETYVTAPLHLVGKVTDDTAVLLTASWRLADHPVATLRGSVGWFGLPVSDATVGLLLRLCRAALGLADGPPVRVGLLGYGAIGAEHAAAFSAVEGLALAAVCDRNEARLAAAPDVDRYTDADALLASADVDLVVVSTPPSTHASWALRALRAGKHVLVEKPFTLTVAEADAVLDAAGDRVVAVYQNRRFDPDYLAIQRLVASGALGEVFHVETFVGGYGHPCNYWHSDEEVSGGAIYDWGSHHLDWVLSLLPSPVAGVSATAQKRVWHDVTNADHSRVTVSFADGAEATFVHSDLAAATKPKWYVLGTGGALVGQWADVAVPTESPALLTLVGTDGSRTSVPTPAGEPYRFHRELADLLHTGAPPTVTAAQARRNVAVMEAATMSAREGGRLVAVTA